MSRSYKKRPFYNIYGVTSQKEDKRLGNRRLRRISKQLTEKWAETDPDIVYPTMDQVLNKWSMPKDGDDWYWPFSEAYEHRWWYKERGTYGQKLTCYKQWFLRVMAK